MYSGSKTMVDSLRETIMAFCDDAVKPASHQAKSCKKKRNLFHNFMLRLLWVYLFSVIIDKQAFQNTEIISCFMVTCKLF